MLQARWRLRLVLLMLDVKLCHSSVSALERELQPSKSRRAIQARSEIARHSACQLPAAASDPGFQRQAVARLRSMLICSAISMHAQVYNTTALISPVARVTTYAWDDVQMMKKRIDVSDHMSSGSW